MEYNYNKFQKDAFIKALNLNKYRYIMKTVKDSEIKLNDDSEESKKFRTTFNSFYRIRRNSTWRKRFYDIFEENRNNNKLDFKSIIEAISDEDTIEASFASKMIATINSKYPIWDQNVLDELEVSDYYNKTEDRIEQANNKYNEIIEKEKQLLKEHEDMIKEFKKQNNASDIEDIKILDFIIWLKQTVEKDDLGE